MKSKVQSSKKSVKKPRKKVTRVEPEKKSSPMKGKKMWFIGTGAIILALSLLAPVVNKILGLKNDNIIEETVEKVIEFGTGRDVDISPWDAE